MGIFDIFKKKKSSDDEFEKMKNNIKRLQKLINNK
jgi:hypothetical protein